MLRNLSSSSTQPPHLRRRQQTLREYGFGRSNWEGNEPSSDTWSSGLDLSIHHPSSHSSILHLLLQHLALADSFTCNRFDALAPPSPTISRDREYHASIPHRRSRNSRGTKEAKRRRDARRNRRKLAAQFLDAQLSREIDETLTRANIHPPPRIAVPPPLPTRVSAFVPKPCIELIRSPSPPPQLPPFNPGRLDLRDFPPLLGPSSYTPPSSPPPVCWGVPSWCPPIPSRNQNGAWNGKLPKFWDLSRLPEPSDSPKVEKKNDPQCQELQLWTRDAGFQPRRQSRFFPPSPKPTVKLPPTACKLHHTEYPLQDPITTAWNCPATPPPPYSFGAFADTGPLIDTTSSPVIRPATMVSPSNLWRIVSEANLDRFNFQPSPQQSEWENEEERMREPTSFQHRPVPVELDSQELPYIHQNSLIGYANESAAYHSGNHCFDDCSGGILSDSAIFLADLFSSVEEAASAYERAAMPWRAQPMSHHITELQDSLSYYPPMDTAAEALTNTDSDDLARSSHHFESEQNLFQAAITTPLPQTPIDTDCDLEMFLSMGHVENCWCRDCDEPPVLVEDEIVFTPSTEEDDWTMWSTDYDEPDMVPQYLFDEDEDELEVIRRRCGAAPEWDAFYPADVEMAFVPELDWFGNADDGMEFADGNEYDWLWNL